MSFTNKGFTVRTEPAGHVFTVAPGQTVLDAAIEQRIGLPYGCRNGKCGSCMATKVSGDIHYPSGKIQAMEGQPSTYCLPCQAVPQSDLVLHVHEVEVAPEIELRTLPCRVAEKTLLNHDVLRLRLRLPQGQRLQYLAGQYLEFLLPDGRRRAYSMANMPGDDEQLELHIRRIPRGSFSDFLFDELEERAILRIQAPLGAFVLREPSDRPLLFIAGGTGFAPIKALIESAFAAGIQRPMQLYWGVRAERDLYLPELPEQWAKAHANLHYTPVLSEPDADWSGRRGLVHEAVLADLEEISGYDVYVSGPPPLVEAARSSCLARGLDPEQFFSDAFEWAADSKTQQ